MICFHYLTKSFLDVSIPKTFCLILKKEALVMQSARIQRAAAEGRGVKTTRATVVIPVYMHVITDKSGTAGNISDSSIRRQMTILNHDFAGWNTDTAAKTRFRFKLMNTTRTRNTAWHNMKVLSKQEERAKRALRDGGKNCLNVYLVDASNTDGSRVLGWATYPGGDPYYDGVVLIHFALPGSDIPFSLDHSLTHEVGHWLGLQHTFDGGCSKRNDEVADTPAAKVTLGACIAGIDTCPQRPGLDSINNFMTYYDDCCKTDFTPGQAERMSTLYDEYRSEY